MGICFHFFMDYLTLPHYSLFIIPYSLTTPPLRGTPPRDGNLLPLFHGLFDTISSFCSTEPVMRSCDPLADFSPLCSSQTIFVQIAEGFLQKKRRYIHNL